MSEKDGKRVLSPAEQAEAEFLTDAYFDSWYRDTPAQLQAYEG